ncbi:MAG: virulence RhuM family protein [Leptospiraceae bacterium]|nr:virulence RhuM family protein [Leptospiraceae bacterium]NUM41986.1 virulence RhuM family protein [Leptospiraceae bacterium]
MPTLLVAKKKKSNKEFLPIIKRNVLPEKNNSDILIYQSDDGQIKIQVRLENETVWLTQAGMVELFQSSKANISEHIKHIFEEGELNENSVIRNFRTTATDGKNYEVNHYNLDVIISVGYRVKSLRGTQFRMWATERLREYLIKGFTMNDDLLKQGGGYFEELLNRIRDIRSSEKVFYRKVLEIYATSIDYDPRASFTQQFFQTVQNKLHWAAHGHTAAEIIYQRANAKLPFMGLTDFKGKKPTKQEIAVAKNYLSEEELAVLNRLVSAYLDIAEINAMQHKPMYMIDWIEVLDGIINVVGLWWNNRQAIFNAHDYGLRVIFKDSVLSIINLKTKILRRPCRAN